MKTLPLLVLIHDGPIGRAYLSRMRQAGLRPESILVIVYNHHPATGKSIAPLLPNILRMPYAKKVQDSSLNYWPRRIRISHPQLFLSMCDILERQYPGAKSVIKNMLASYNYEEFTDRTKYVFANTINDETIIEALKELDAKTVLFTGGGIVRKELFSIPGIRFLHIHPGYLPYVRGADGLLWSTLVRKRPGVSAFFMSENIDTGDIIRADELEPLCFPYTDNKGIDDSLLYRALFSFYDPILRAELLLKVLTDYEAKGEFITHPQDLSEGTTFNFMNKKLREIALRRIFIY